MHQGNILNSAMSGASWARASWGSGVELPGQPYPFSPAGLLTAGARRYRPGSSTLRQVGEMFERSAFAERLAYSPDEAAELLGISRELVHDLLRTGQLRSVKAGRRRLIGKHHLEEFLTGGQ